MDGRKQRDLVDLQCSSVSCGATRENEQGKIKSKRNQSTIYFIPLKITITLSFIKDSFRTAQ